MRWDDSDDPFSDIFREIERMMDEMAGIDVDTVEGSASDTDVHISVYEEGESVRVVADLPGATRDDVVVKCDGHFLTIDATATDREYRERLRLPGRVDENGASATINNGVLEIVLDRVGTNAGVDID